MGGPNKADSNQPPPDAAPDQAANCNSQWIDIFKDFENASLRLNNVLLKDKEINSIAYKSLTRFYCALENSWLLNYLKVLK